MAEVQAPPPSQPCAAPRRQLGHTEPDASPASWLLASSVVIYILGSMSRCILGSSIPSCQLLRCDLSQCKPEPRPLRGET